MAESLRLFPLRGQAGIKRDGTDTEGNYWSNGIWTRFFRGLPRSMLGYRSLSEDYPGPSRGLLVNANGQGFLNIFSGSANELDVGQFTSAGIGSGNVNITPAGFAGDPNNVWQLDTFFNSNGGNSVSIVGHAAPNLASIASAAARPVYYGDVNGVVPLIPSIVTGTSDPFEVDGGILSLPPFLIAYGSSGLYAWSALNDPTNFPIANAANICSSKIVKGLSIRGGANSPSALLWSLNDVIQASFVGGSTIWAFNNLSDQSSILSSSGPVEMDGIYYWPGIDRFLVFNGVLRELPNELNIDFFFENLNFAQRQKVFGFKMPRWGEICWCAPMFGATECNWMFVYNVREGTWYDTPLPVDGRSAAYFAQAWQYPILSSANGMPALTGSGTSFPLWQHEYGVDQIRGSEADAIPSSIISPSMSLVGGGLSALGNPVSGPDDVWTEFAYFEQDFDFGPNLRLSVLGREYPQDQDSVLDARMITKLPQGNSYDLQVQQRYLRWKIESNVGGGFFKMGQPLIGFRPGDRSR